MRHARVLAFAVAIAALASCARDNTVPTDATQQPSLSVASGSGGTYLILGKGNRLPADLATKVSQAGGTLTGSVPAIGVATATSTDANFQSAASAISGVEAVALDEPVQWIDPTMRVVELGEGVEETGAGAASHGDNETFYNAQWAPKAIDAPDAWDLGALGAGVRVAVLDGGLNDTHIDLVGGVDVAASASFVPGFLFWQDVGNFSHATHVAGIIAARDNSIGTIGIAPSATIIGVKVLHGGTGSFGGVIQGIVYAATPISDGGAGADIINMSLGAAFNLQGRDAAELVNALTRATTYAYQQGTTVIVSAGNSGLDLDHSGNIISVPAQSANANNIAATGPVGFAVGYPNGATNFDRPASYTNFGQSAIDFSAPGGDFALPGNASCTLPRIPTGSVIAPCWVFDMVLSPGSRKGFSNTSYSWAAGTSMAAPHVAGVAALIIEANGGSMHPAAVAAALRASADDAGKVGHDAFHGGGFVNALTAVQ